MNTKHTPGEWKVSSQTPCRVDTANGSITVSWTCNFDGGKREQEAEANASLIAAAPELLEACSLLLEALRSSNVSNGLIRSAEDAARAAIAKARGGA
jgi:hypothetical protein